MHRILILKGSPRKDGNTNALTEPFAEQLQAGGCQVEEIDLVDKNLEPCCACRACQKDWTHFGCIRNDEMQSIYDAIMRCEIVVFATPIYSWYCTPPVKMVLDRMVYGMNKYYGETKGPSQWRGKQIALLTTSGYPPEQGADLLQEGLKRYCKHSQIQFAGMLAERHLGYDTIFMNPEKEAHARQFANQIIDRFRA